MIRALRYLSRHLASASAFASLFLATDPAAAFHSGSLFDKAPGAGGGGGIFYAGAPLDRRWDCSTCHVDAPRLVKVRLRVEPRDLFEGFRYTPERPYTFTATLEGEPRGRGSPRANSNGLTIQVTGIDGLPAGALSARPDDFYAGGPSLLTSAGQKVGVTTWTFDWTAPPKGGGRVLFHVAGVDGNGAGAGPSSTLTDPYGDDVFVARVTLDEAGGVTAGPAPAAPQPREEAPREQAIALGLSGVFLVLSRKRLTKQCKGGG